MHVSRHVVVRGRVQGVGYRAFVADEAERRGIAGWVRNRHDGTVEALFCGSPELVDLLADFVNHLPQDHRRRSLAPQSITVTRAPRHS